VSMEERVRLVGGSLEIESAPGHGTCVRATVPLAEESPE
jgi:signal transduction histidine kinase